MDVCFGGGEPDFTRLSKDGRLQPLEVFGRHPEWFGGRGVPEGFAGEIYRGPRQDWVACCLAQFGICSNPDECARLGVPVPRCWGDLGDARLAGAVALADPMKSGSVARAFELVIQAAMEARIRSGLPEEQALAAGWSDGLRLIQRMTANARYFSDSAAKIPRDVAQGEAAAGMCIDLYGRAYEASLRRPDGGSRVVWLAPAEGAPPSADPVAVLRGAPHPQVAQAFVEFCLSPEGQRLWFARTGVPGGPQRHPLHRMPVRRDSYEDPEWRAAGGGPGPYESAGPLVYHREWTGASFHWIRQLVRVMCIDPHDELADAWRAMRAAGFPSDSMAVFGDVSAVPYPGRGVAGGGGLNARDPVQAAARAVELGEWFRGNYRRAADLARGHTTGGAR